jgi:hypothetical protein
MRPIHSLAVSSITVLLTVVGLFQWSDWLAQPGGQPETPKPQVAERPFLAIWRRDGGRLGGWEAPYLRFAIWSDGRVLFAKDPEKWAHELRRGKINSSRVARLKAALPDSGIFDLKGTCYLMPDKPTDCLMVDLLDKKQMMYWDEVESPDYGINVNPKPHHLDFKRCWKIVNHLALVALLPDDGEPVKDRFEVPKSWYLKRAIQSD